KVELNGLTAKGVSFGLHNIHYSGRYFCDDKDNIITSYHNSGNVRVYLPSGDDLKGGRMMVIERVNNGSLTIDGNGNRLIGGSNSEASHSASQRVTYLLFWDG